MEFRFRMRYIRTSYWNKDIESYTCIPKKKIILFLFQFRIRCIRNFDWNKVIEYLYCIL